MSLIYHRLIPAIWIAFWVFWLVLARRVRQTRRAEPPRNRLIYLALVVAAMALIAAPQFGRGILGRQMLDGGAVRFWVGSALLIAGLGFAVWARVHIGEYWSGTVTLKEGHRLIRTGPYALVRHPIYTGILLGFFGTAVALGEVRGFAALLLLTVLHVFKSRKEERWLGQEFGEEYVRYRKEVPALVPFSPW